jgi:hypothetical protein
MNDSTLDTKTSPERGESRVRLAKGFKSLAALVAVYILLCECQALGYDFGLPIALPWQLWRHRKRGSFYLVLLVNVKREYDLEPVAVYLALRDFSLWDRPMCEFFDGRFERVSWFSLLTKALTAKQNGGAKNHGK